MTPDHPEAVDYAAAATELERAAASERVIALLPLPLRVIEWSSHAPTTIVGDVGGRQLVIAECGGNGCHSDENSQRAAAITHAANNYPALLKALNNLYLWHTRTGPLLEAFRADALAQFLNDAEDAIVGATKARS